MSAGALVGVRVPRGNADFETEAVVHEFDIRSVITIFERRVPGVAFEQVKQVGRPGSVLYDRHGW